MIGSFALNQLLATPVVWLLQPASLKRGRHEGTSITRCSVLWSSQPETMLAAVKNFFGWEALRLAWELRVDRFPSLARPGAEAMLIVHRMLLRDPHIWMPKLERLTSLAMRSALQHGRLVFRADPGPL